MPGVKFPDIEDIVENIVDEVFLDKQREDGVYDYRSLPKNPRACVELPEISACVAQLGQLRISLHLAKFVKSATLRSACSERTHIDGYYAMTPGKGDPRTVSRTALKWFLDACPQLSQLSLHGGDFVYALSAQSLETVKLTDINLIGCFVCSARFRTQCTAALPRGWLKHIVTFPHLQELDITSYAMDGGPTDVTVDVQSRSSPCTGLSISNLTQHTSPRSLTTLIRSMPALKKLVLDGLQPMARGQLKKCLGIAAPTLTFLALNDYHSEEGRPQPWENDTVAGLHQLETLCLNGVPATVPLLLTLPPRVSRLRLSGATLTFLPTPVLAAWLRCEPFPLRGVLKKLEVDGDLRAGGALQGPDASDAQVAELTQLCHALGIEWIHTPTMYGGDSEEDAGFSDDDNDDGEFAISHLAF
ncbi:hypothetical protein C8R44DRAFT_975804 [Mycena epipterygia]|nr:hypothetical protein C8R44DRAFT_975804 [Mycena epipterygia]